MTRTVLIVILLLTPWVNYGSHPYEMIKDVLKYCTQRVTFFVHFSILMFLASI